MRKYYHYTNINNLEDIQNTKKLKAINGAVYVCKSIEDLSVFLNLYKWTTNLEEVVIIEFTTNDKLEESSDHCVALLGGAKAFSSSKDIKINILDVQKLDFKYDDETRKNMELNQLRMKLMQMEYDIKMGKAELTKEYNILKEKHKNMCVDLGINPNYNI